MNIKIIEREREILVRELKIKFIEKVKIDINSLEEIYDRDIEIENTENLYKKYREIKKMNSVDEIIKIREKYGLNQSDYSLILGFGKVTIHRYENGMLQTEANDMAITLSKDVKNMRKMCLTNGDKISVEGLKILSIKLEELEEVERHKILDKNKLNSADKIEKFESIPAIDVAKKMLFLAEKMDNPLSPLRLQKLLYYVQGVSLGIFERKVFNENILNWEYGPVVRNIYDYYKNYDRREMTNNSDILISKEIENIILAVLESYGQYSTSKLVELTHEELPWKSTKRNEIIDTKIMESYFKKIYVD